MVIAQTISPFPDTVTPAMETAITPRIDTQSLWTGLSIRRPVVLVRQADGAVLDANEKFCALLGRDRSALLDLTLAALHDEIELELIEQRHDLVHGLIPSAELCLRRPDGAPVWLFIEGFDHPEVDGAACRLLLGLECAEQVQTRIETAGQLEALRRGQGIAEYDLEGNLLDANDMFYGLLSASAEGLRGAKHQTLCEPMFAWSDYYSSWWERIRRGEADEGTRRYIDSLGHEVWLREIFVPIFGIDGRPTRILHAALDVTKGRSAELRMLESMSYASRIQHAMHDPSREVLSNWMADHHSLVWQPREPVGGDCFFARKVGDDLWLCLFDCTGHGAPGAMLATIVLSLVDRIFSTDDGEMSPGDVLERLNRRIKVVLDQEHPRPDIDSGSDDGVDGAVICLKVESQSALIASTGLPVFILEPGREPTMQRWAGGGLGYRIVPGDRQWPTREVACPPGTRLFISTDGVFDQIGGPRGMGYSATRFLQSLRQHADLPIALQGEAAFRDFAQYQGTQQRRDDLSYVGLQMPSA